MPTPRGSAILIALLLTAALAAGLMATSRPAFALAPVNDNFAGAKVISALTYVDGVDTSEATDQTGEPQCGFLTYAKTVWYRFTPTQSDRFQARTTGSGFDTVLGVWTGSSIDALTSVACNDDTSGVRTSRLQFDGIAGTTYYFQLGGFAGDSGAGFFLLEAFPDPPANDNLANAVVVSSGQLKYHDARRTDGATLEVSEPQNCDIAGATMWYAFTPALSGSYIVDTAGSDFDTNVSVWQGTTFATMLPWACNANIDGSYQARVQFNATAGQQYRIQVGGYQGDGGNAETHIFGEDSDGDGCSNIEEGSANPVFGGDRDAQFFYDFFDVTGDAAVDIDDTLFILGHFGHGPNDDPIDDLLDRSAPDPARPYRTSTEFNNGDEGIDLADALLNLASFGHSCAGAP